MRLSILTSCLVFLCLFARAEDEFTVYRAQFRTPEQLVEMARPLFGREATFGTIHDKVVINAPRLTAEKVLKLFGEVDRSPRKYRISFRQANEARSTAEDVGFERGVFSTGKGGAVVRGKARAESRETKGIGQSVKVVEVLEGGEASLAFGDFWQTEGLAAKVRGGPANAATLTFSQRGTGANPAPSLSSETRVHLGEWQKLGEVTGARSDRQGGILRKSGTESSSRKELEVRVDLVP